MSEEFLSEMRRKWVPIYILALLSIVFITAHLILNYIHTKNSMYINWLIPLLFLAMYILFSFSRLLKMKISVYTYYRVIRCTKCGYEEVGKTEGKTYLFSREGKCPKCSGDMVVVKVYKKKTLKGITK
mgnify:CR=1 FL=1